MLPMAGAIIDRIGVDPKYKGGSIRMAAASAAIDQGVPIEVGLNAGRWSSWQVFSTFDQPSKAFVRWPRALA